MASGKPIVATDIAGFSHVLTHGREGLLVEPKNKRQLATVLEALINGPTLRQDLGSAGLRTVQQYDWERVIDQVQDVYRQASARPRPVPQMRLEPTLSAN
jgi:phosphatidylinositol alpha-mannosyltransferase